MTAAFRKRSSAAASQARNLQSKPIEPQHQGRSVELSSSSDKQARNVSSGFGLSPVKPLQTAQSLRPSPHNIFSSHHTGSPFSDYPTRSDSSATIFHHTSPHSAPMHDKAMSAYHIKANAKIRNSPKTATAALANIRKRQYSAGEYLVQAEPSPFYSPPNAKRLCLERKDTDLLKKMRESSVTSPEKQSSPLRPRQLIPRIPTKTNEDPFIHHGPISESDRRNWLKSDISILSQMESDNEASGSEAEDNVSVASDSEDEGISFDKENVPVSASAHRVFIRSHGDDSDHEPLDYANTSEDEDDEADIVDQICDHAHESVGIGHTGQRPFDSYHPSETFSGLNAALELIMDEMAAVQPSDSEAFARALTKHLDCVYAARNAILRRIDS